METEYTHLFKIILIGNSGVGKTSLLNRYIDNTYHGNYISTIGVDFKIKTLKVSSDLIKLQIWDTAGQERFRTITSAYYRGAHGIIIVFDMTDLDSFTKVTEWLDEIKARANEKVEIYLIGNKIDLKDEICVQKEDIEAFKKEHNIADSNFMEVSAKDGYQVDELFFKLADKLAKREKAEGPIVSKDKEAFKLNCKDDDNKKFGCC
ncbi:small GTP-binding protein domain [Edhazardia aedis USNM 41457]|uniref:Small GTP-binding protein domain n=1 Tax=Edhazardia aedis (strain USNM 41457) TaxID=1003232 RepID=J9D8M1_EDHAE|nr:small GTP-binding protein domain [Edhazardia aedis USNM 41457]|eukprot:EJW04091.1 small GTP-binding protein domain [Edhazardia aedis USNM 41457]